MPVDHVHAESSNTMAARIEQRALRLSALLREIDNEPLEFEPGLRDQIDYVLEMLAYRVSATRALLRMSPGPVAA